MRLTKITLIVTMFASALALAPSTRAAMPAASRWFVLLNEKPAAERFPGRVEGTRAAAEPYRQHLRQVQAGMRPRIEGLHARVTGSLQHLLNGIFVVANPEQAAALRQLPGVKAVMPMRRYRKLDQLSISNVEAAWNVSTIGGESNAGAGIKIGIIDTGIDQTHPAFQDSSLVAPAGYPIADTQADLAFTSNKVIVARSYVGDIIYSNDTSSTDLAAQSRPDDVTARDLDGHGTGVASVAAGVATTYNGVTITGVAPKAFLGNYKVFGSNDVNPNGSGNILQALEDAVTDGMDVVNLSLGGSAYGGPLDTSATQCLNTGLPNSPIPILADACDPLAYEIESAMQNALVTVVVAAGNQGADGYQFNYGCSSPPCYSAPTYASVGSPAYAPSAIAVGGIQNDVTYVQQVEVSGFQTIVAFESYDGPPPLTPLTAPLVDATKIGSDLCNAVGPSALAGEIALVTAGSCTDVTIVTNAQLAHAVGVIEIAQAASFLPPFGLAGSSIPAFIIGQTDGNALKSFIDSNPRASATMDPRPYRMSASSLGLTANSVAFFSSRGPVVATGALKPDLVAAATDFLIPAESYDPSGELFNFSGYGTTQGTSFATPVVTGSAALVRQSNLNLTPLQINITPVASQNLGLYNTGASQVSLLMNVVPSAGHSSSTSQVLVNNGSSATVAVPANGTASVSVTLTGSQVAAGRFEGVITATGGTVPLTIPYLYVVGDGIPYDVIPLNDVEPGQGFTAFDGVVGAQIPWTQACSDVNNSCINDYGPVAVQVVDQFGAPVSGVAVTWAATQGGGSVVQNSNYTDSFTDVNGIAGATVNLGPNVGTQEFTATVNGMVMPFDGYARLAPAINTNGIVDAASFTGGKAVAPGSLISVFGLNMTDITDGADGINYPYANCSLCNVLTQPLPMGIDGAAFSFDTANLSLPGRFSFVNPQQLNVQVPWELAGQSSAIVKSIVNYTYSSEYTLALAAYSPGFFINDQPSQAVAAEDLSYAVVTSGNPVARGSIVQLFLNGLGPVSCTAGAPSCTAANQPADGVGAPVTILARTTTDPAITIGGQPAPVQFSGLTPGFVGLYQVNVTVPSGIGTGIQPITCSIGGVTAKAGTLAVK